MTTAAASPAAPAEARAVAPENVLYRDDGPLALAIGRALGPVVGVPAMALLLAGTGGVLVVAAIAWRDASTALAAAAVAWLVLTLGITSERWPKPSFHWAVPPLLRLGEYATLTWLAAIQGAEPGALALLGVLAFRHYDMVYRLRHRGDRTPRWLNLLTAGWDGRVIIAWVLLAAGVIEDAMFIWAAVLGVASLAETVVAWRRFERGRGAAGEFDEIEGEAE